MNKSSIFFAGTSALLLLFIFFKSKNEISRSEYESLQLENNQNKIIIDNLKNSPEMLFGRALKLRNDDSIVESRNHFKKILVQYPGRFEAKEAEKYLANLEKDYKAKLEEQERIKNLGFKAFSELSTFKLGGLKYNIRSINQSNSFTFDSYDDQYFYRAATRGSKYIVAKISISSESNNPNLLPIFAYKLINGKLEYIGNLEYRFTRWKDYGSYLGNYSDYGNDFSHTKTITFNCGLEISNEDLNNSPIFIILRKDDCVFRSEDRFGNPPVSYKVEACKSQKILTPQNLEQDYFVVKIFNKNKI